MPRCIFLGFLTRLVSQNRRSPRLADAASARRTPRNSLPTVGLFLELDGEIHGLSVVETVSPGLASVSLDDLEDAELHGHHLEANTAARLQSISAPEEIDACCIGVDKQSAELIDTLQKGWMHV